MKYLIQINNLKEYLYVSRILMQRLKMDSKMWESIDEMFLNDENAFIMHTADGLVVNIHQTPLNIIEVRPALTRENYDDSHELIEIDRLADHTHFVLPSGHVYNDLAIPIEDLDFSVRLYNCLKFSGYEIHTMEDIIKHRRNQFLMLRNFGQRTLTELESVLHRFGLSLKN